MKTSIHGFILAFLSAAVILSGCAGDHDFSEKNRFNSVNLINLTWHVKTGFEEHDKKGFNKNATGVIKIDKFPILPSFLFEDYKDETQHFSAMAQFEIDSDPQKIIEPIGIYLSGIGENWEIYINGHIIKREVNISENGLISVNRTVRGLLEPINADYLHEGKNIIIVHFIGERPLPKLLSNNFTGFFHRYNYSIDLMRSLKWKNIDIFKFHVNGLLVFMGIFYIVFYLKRRSERYNLFFGLFSLLAALFFFTRTDYIFGLFRNSNITYMIEYICIINMMPLLVLLLHYYFEPETKISIKSLITVSTSMLLTILILAVPYKYLMVVLRIWHILAVFMIMIVSIELVKEIRLKRRDSIGFTLAIGILIITAFWDIAGSIVSGISLRLFNIGFLISSYMLAFFMLNRFLRMQKETEELNVTLEKQRDAFYRFVPVNFLDLLGRKSLMDISLGDSTQLNMSVLFSDIRAFTAMSEKMQPSENFNFINGFLNYMEPAIKKYGGFVDKYIGDAIMALFTQGENGLHSSNRAVDAAIEMRKVLGEFNSTRKQPVEIGIGVNSGPLMLGTVGSESRLDTTVIGNTVNLSSRLESLTSYYKLGILISGWTKQSLEDPDRYLIREVDSVVVKGKSEPVVIYEVFNSDSEDMRDFKEKTRAELLMAIVNYKNRDFREALKILKNLYRINQNDRLIGIYINRCRKFIKESPPEDWNGVVILSGK
ncbi:MAG TPA: adenylate/guanylate cyclase domain-containing protein [Spirochaetota bacterium]|nr:adenylate/guanylate cyclase domain-containing protein [Spirochaetota bacterium]